MTMESTRLRHYPETAAGGFSRVDGTMQFFARVQSLLGPGQCVLEFGAGRGHELLEDPVPARHRLRQLGGDGRTVIGVDVDPVVMTNPHLDSAYVINPSDRLPIEDASIDLIVSDNVFEHVDNPEHVASELNCVLKPGGWICARTPNKWSYVGVAVRMVPNSLHTQLLEKLQPGRKSEDVFPTRYRLNSRAALKRHFPPDRFCHATYSWDAEPVYVGGVSPAWLMMRLVHRLTPRPYRGVWFIFLQKRS